MKKIIIAIVIIVIIAIIIRFCAMSVRMPELQQEINAVEVTTGEISVTLNEIGEINPSRKIDIKSRISGKVVTYYVDEGDYVENGQLIAEIEPDFNQANEIANIRNSIHITRLRLNNAEKEYERKQELYNHQFISKDEVDRALDDLEIANINYQSALQQYELIKEIDTEGNISRINSTAAGTVIEKPVEEGEMVISSASSFSDGTVILKIADLDRMVVNSFINEVDISKVHLHQTVTVLVDAFPYESFKGRIERIGAVATTRNNVKVFPIEINILDENTPLRPGMTANVTIHGESKTDILVIPIRAIFSDEDGNDIVYKVVNDSLATEGTHIRTGINDFNIVEIIDGLQEGDRVSLREPRIQ